MTHALLEMVENPKLPGFLIERIKHPSRMSWSAVELLLSVEGNKWMTNAEIGMAFGIDTEEPRHLTRLMFEAGTLERMRTPGARIGYSYRLNTKEKKA